MVRSWLVSYVVAAVLFGVLDGLWLGLVAGPVYTEHLGPLLAERANVGAAVAFYLIYLVGVVHFALRPALAEGSWRRALGSGALLGLVAYATWTLTNLAVLAGFPAITLLDLAWGAIGTSLTALGAYAACRVLPWTRPVSP